jgi:hypothetical protein
MLNHNHRCPPLLLRYLGGAGVLAATLLGACGSPPPAATTVVGQHRAPLGSYPVLSFRADWSVTQSAPLVAGQPAVLHYELARLASCRGPGWNIAGSFTTPTIHRHDLSIPGTSRTGAVELFFAVPFGPQMSLWFEGSDGSGCRAWDSDFGRNFQVAPSNPDRVIHFTRDYQSRVDGPLQAGVPFTVDYDLWRLPFCVGVTQYDTLSGSATLFYRFDGGAVQAEPMLGLPPGVPGEVDGQPGQLQLAPTLTPPPGARSVELWFLGSNDGPCTDWDSDYGRNYSFPISP